MQDILNKVQIHMPFRMLRETYLPMVIRERINPEIGFNSTVLDAYGQDEFREIADRLRDAGRTVTFHAPFMDLRPGAIDSKVRQATVDRLRQVFDLAPYFRPRSIVCHPSFDERYYVSTEEIWLKNSIDTWQTFLSLAESIDTIIALENVYETEPRPLQRLLGAFSSVHLCFCFDAGHFNAFAKTPLQAWMEQLGPFIGQLHLHDNRGQTDEHLPVGDGVFPFGILLKEIHARGRHPIITLEAHSEAHLWRTLENIKKMKLLDEVDAC
jgi:sugar phosphate isomerase/epimerase